MMYVDYRYPVMILDQTLPQMKVKEQWIMYYKQQILCIYFQKIMLIDGNGMYLLDQKSHS